MRNAAIVITLSLALGGLSGCQRSSTPADSANAGPNSPPGSRCANPTPASTMDGTITVDVPSDTDLTANPTPTTVVPFTVLMPRRCAGETFPLVLYNHGFSESRIKTIGNDDTKPINEGNAKPLLDRGYVVMSFDERGHGDNRPSKGGGYARLIDPNVETRDARGLLDWAYDHAAEIHVQTEPGSGIPRDLKVGTMGASYGGAAQMMLAALDPRVDVITPDRTWHDLLYTMLPGDVVKTWLRLFSTVIQIDEISNGAGVTATPAARTGANQVGPLALNANLVRTHADFSAAASAPTAQPRAVSEQEGIDLLYTHSMDYLESQQAAGKPWGFGETVAKLRPIPALFIQGNRDMLFNATEAYWNSRYFAAAGGNVRLLIFEDGHLNPLAGLTRGVDACGKFDSQAVALAWLDYYLKGQNSAAFRATPKVCISVLDSGDKTAKPVGVTLDRYPVGSLNGIGAVPTSVAKLNGVVDLTATADGVFVPMTTIQGNDKVLAGAPRIGKLVVTPGTGNVQTAIAIVGVGIQRAGQTILVDEQVTAFVEGTHDSNRGVAHPGELLLPGLGERLQDGDQVGLLFYPQHKQFAPVVAAQNIGGLPGALPLPITGLDTLPALLSSLDPVLGLATLPNPYNVIASDVELPILIPGQYPGSSLSQ